MLQALDLVRLPLAAFWPEVLIAAFSALLGLQGISCTTVTANRLIEQIVLCKSAFLNVSNWHFKDLIAIIDESTSL